MRDFVAITYNARGALITYQASVVGLDKKLSNPIGLLNFLEVTAGFEPADNGVADRGLTTWLRHHKKLERITGLEPATFALARRRSTK